MTIMKCGHTANATNNNHPVCVVCLGIKDGADKISTEKVDITGRVARCVYSSQHNKPSSENLAFFKYCPDQPVDSYYCGCFGWD